jgi:hypothetical protein
MSDFELAMQEFIKNGGVIETLPYQGPKENDVGATQRKNVDRSTIIPGETDLDSVIKEIESLEEL